MPAELPQARLAGPRARRLRDPQPDTIVAASPFRAPALAAAGHLACIATPGALPFRDGSLGRVHIDRDLPRDELPAAVAQTARALAPASTVDLEVHVHYGTTGFARWLASGIVGAPAPASPETVARLLFDCGFDRIEQRLDHALARFHARRLPGRPLIDDG